MRSGRDNGILKSESGQLIGINLGADYCSEHEWGIKDLRRDLGMSETGYGLAKRTATKMPKNVEFYDNKIETVLVVNGYSHDGKINLDNHNLGRGSYNREKLLTAWDSKSFGVSATLPEEREAIRKVYEAMQNGNMAVWLGGGGVFQNAGLVLAIVDQIPADKTQMLHDADIESEKLTQAAEATGIHEKLKAAGKRYFALSPKWMQGFNPQNKNPKSKHPVMFWLNPMNQHENNYGWFTVEELELWAKGEGPCVMSAEQKRKKG